MANLPNGTQSEQDQSIGTLNLKIPVERLRDMPVEHLDAIHDLATGQLPGAKPATRFGVPIVQPGPAQRAPSTLKRFAGGVGRVGKDIASPFTFMGSTIKGNVQTIQDIRRARAEEARGTAAHQQAEAGLEQAQVAAGLPAAQAAEATGRGAYAGAEAQALQKGLSAIEDPNVQGAWKTLSDPKAPLDQRRDAMATIGQAFGAVPMLRGELGAAENIYRQGEVGSRVGPKMTIQTPQGPAQLMTDREGNPVMEGLASPSFYQHGRQQYMRTTDAAGNEHVFAVTPVSGPMLPGVEGAPAKPATPGAGATPRAQAGGLAPGEGGAVGTAVGHRPLSAAAKTQIAAIDTTMGTLNQLRDTVNDLDKQYSGGQLSDVAAKNALWAAYRAGFATQLSQMQAQVSLDRILGSLAYMKGTRAYRWIREIQKHLPRATDSYALMKEKIDNAEQVLPWVKYGNLVVEGIVPPNADKLGMGDDGQVYAHYKSGKVVPIPF